MGINTFPATTSNAIAVRKRISSSFVPETGTPSVHPMTYGTATGGVATKYANNTWVTIAPGGRILTSTDGLTWNHLNNNLAQVLADKTTSYAIGYRPTFACKSLEYANSTWVGYFDNSVVAKSTDLITWTVVLDLSSNTSNTGDGNGLNKVSSTGSVVWNGSASLWMVGNGLPALYTSPDLVTWTERTTAWSTAAGAANPIRKVAWANQLFIIVDSGGLIVTSSDGITYTLRTNVFGASAATDIATNASGGTANATTIIVADSGKWAYSTNGTTWTLNTANGTVNHVNCVWDGSRFVIIGTSGTASWYSSNGQGGMTTGATPAQGTAVRLAQHLSTDGAGKVVWMSITTFQTTTNITVSWNTVSTYAVIGTAESPLISSANSRVYSNRRNSCVDGAGKIWFVSGRPGKVLVSSDNGVTWQFHSSVLTNIDNSTVTNNITINGIWYLNNTLFAADNNAGLRISTDNGATWSTRYTGFTSGIIGMAYGNGVYIAICPNVLGTTSTNSVFRSTNGTTWTAISAGSAGGASSKLFYNGGGTTADTWIPKHIHFISDVNKGFFEIEAEHPSTDSAGVFSRSVNGLYWIDGVGGAYTTTSGDQIAMYIDLNAAASGTSTQTYSTRLTTSSLTESSTLQFDTGDGITCALIRYATATASQQYMYLAYRQNVSWQGQKDTFTTAKVRGNAPYLNWEGATSGTVAGAEAAYMKYHPNIGWVCAYIVTDTNVAGRNLVILASGDGKEWDVVYNAELTLVGAGNQTVVPYFISNDSDRLLIVLWTNATSTLANVDVTLKALTTSIPAVS